MLRDTLRAAALLTLGPVAKALGLELALAGAEAAAEAHITEVVRDLDRSDAELVAVMAARDAAAVSRDSFLDGMRIRERERDEARAETLALREQFAALYAFALFHLRCSTPSCKSRLAAWAPLAEPTQGERVRIEARRRAQDAAEMAFHAEEDA